VITGSELGRVVLKTLGNRRRVAPAVLAAAAAAAVVIAGAPGPSAEAATPVVYSSEFINQPPTPMPGLPAGVTQVATGVGGNFGLALLPGGTVSGWGINSSANSFGQLGDGTTTNHTSPAPVLNLSGITQIAGGGDHALAIGAGGAMWTWGDNDNGQLGDSTTTTRLTPVRIPGPTAMIQVAGGEDYSLGLRSDGTVWAWGNNNTGQLGDGTTTQHAKPKQIPGLTKITQIAAGNSSSFALRSDGTLFAWGNNHEGELGDGTTTTRLSPVPVPGLTGVTAVSSGLFSTLAIAGPNHNVWGWGDNSAGQVGDGSKTGRLSPVQTGLFNATTVNAGVFESGAIRSDGTLWLWGDQITDPTLQPSLTGVTHVSLGDVVDLVIAQPPVTAPPNSTVPNLRGETVTQASSALRSAGLTLGGENTVVDNTCNNINEVLSQSPAAGTSLPAGSSVSITIGVKPKNPCP
jgi:alpha-tubulin suppressor-like RCC1 family protein